MINITLKDGTIMQVENGATCLDVAKQISAGLARAARHGRFWQWPAAVR